MGLRPIETPTREAVQPAALTARQVTQATEQHENENFLERLGAWLGAPGYAVRNIGMAPVQGPGKIVDAIENLADFVTGTPTLGYWNPLRLATDREERPEFTQQIEAYQEAGWPVRPPESDLGRLAIDIAGGIVQDPLSWVSFGSTGAVTGVAKTASKAGRLRKLVPLLQRTSRGKKAMTAAREATADVFAKRGMDVMKQFGVKADEAHDVLAARKVLEETGEAAIEGQLRELGKRGLIEYGGVRVAPLGITRFQMGGALAPGKDYLRAYLASGTAPGLIWKGFRKAYPEAAGIIGGKASSLSQAVARGIFNKLKGVSPRVRDLYSKMSGTRNILNNKWRQTFERSIGRLSDGQAVALGRELIKGGNPDEVVARLGPKTEQERQLLLQAATDWRESFAEMWQQKKELGMFAGEEVAPEYMPHQYSKSLEDLVQKTLNKGDPQSYKQVMAQVENVFNKRREIATAEEFEEFARRRMSAILGEDVPVEDAVNYNVKDLFQRAWRAHTDEYTSKTFLDQMRKYESEIGQFQRGEEVAEVDDLADILAGRVPPAAPPTTPGPVKLPVERILEGPGIHRPDRLLPAEEPIAGLLGPGLPERQRQLMAQVRETGGVGFPARRAGAIGMPGRVESAGLLPPAPTVTPPAGVTAPAIDYTALQTADDFYRAYNDAVGVALESGEPEVVINALESAEEVAVRARQAGIENADDMVGELTQITDELIRPPMFERGFNDAIDAAMQASDQPEVMMRSLESAERIAMKARQFGLEDVADDMFEDLSQVSDDLLGAGRPEEVPEPGGMFGEESLGVEPIPQPTRTVTGGMIDALEGVPEPQLIRGFQEAMNVAETTTDFDEGLTAIAAARAIAMHADEVGAGFAGGALDEVAELERHLQVDVPFAEGPAIPTEHLEDYVLEPGRQRFEDRPLYAAVEEIDNDLNRLQELMEDWEPVGRGEANPRKVEALRILDDVEKRLQEMDAAPSAIKYVGTVRGYLNRGQAERIKKASKLRILRKQLGGTTTVMDPTKEIMGEELRKAGIELPLIRGTEAKISREGTLLKGPVVGGYLPQGREVSGLARRIPEEPTLGPIPATGMPAAPSLEGPVPGASYGAREVPISSSVDDVIEALEGPVEPGAGAVPWLRSPSPEEQYYRRLYQQHYGLGPLDTPRIPEEAAMADDWTAKAQEAVPPPEPPKPAQLPPKELRFGFTDPDVEAEAIRLLTHLTPREGVQKMLETYQRYMRAGITVGTLGIPWPAYHVRNAISAIFQSMLDPDIGPINALRGTMHLIGDLMFAKVGGMKTSHAAMTHRALPLLFLEERPRMIRDLAEITSPRELRKYVREMKRATRGLEELRNLPDVGYYSSEEAAKLALEHNVLHNFIESELVTKELGKLAAEQPEIVKRLFTVAPGKQMVEFIERHPRFRASLEKINKMLQGDGLPKEVATKVENMHRLGAFYKLLKQNVEPGEAAARTRRAFVDYEYASAAQRWIRDLFPFSQFTLGTIPVVAEEALRRPATILPITKTVRAGEGEERVTPPWLKEAVSIPVGTGEDRNQMYLTRLGVVQEELNQLGTGEGPGRTFEKGVLARLTPFLRAPVELATDRSFFTGEQMSDFRFFPGLSPTTETLITASPFSRVAYTIRKIADDRKPAWTRALNVLTGATVATVDDEQALRNLLTEYFQEKAEQGDLQTFTRFYQRGEIDPELQALLEQYYDRG